MPGTPAPPARARTPLTFAGAAGTHFRGLRAGRTGPSRGPGAGPRGEDATKRCPEFRLALEPGKEIPVEEPPGAARGAGSRPRCSRAAVRSPADTGGARVSGRKRLSHFLQSPHSSAPSAPALPSLSPAPFPKPAAPVGARKTRNLNGCSVRRLPPRQVSSRSRTPACLLALPPPGPGSLPVRRAHPRHGAVAFPHAGTSPDLKADLQAPASIHPLIPVLLPAFEPILNHLTQTGNEYLLVNLINPFFFFLSFSHNEKSKA